jgi:hypothetical protein
MTHAPLVADGRSALRRKAEARFDLRLNPKSAYRPAGGGLIGALGAGLVVPDPVVAGGVIGAVRVAVEVAGEFGLDAVFVVLPPQ